MSSRRLCRCSRSEPQKINAQAFGSRSFAMTVCFSNLGADPPVPGIPSVPIFERTRRHASSLSITIQVGRARAVSVEQCDHDIERRELRGALTRAVSDHFVVFASDPPSHVGIHSLICCVAGTSVIGRRMRVELIIAQVGSFLIHREKKDRPESSKLLLNVRRSLDHDRVLG